MAAAGAGKTVGVVFGAFICLGLVLLAIAAAIILSLISTFTPNNSQQSNGDEYRVNALMLKSLYTNVSYAFSNSTMATNPALSDACTNTVKAAGQANVAGCVVQNNFAYGPANTNTNSKRRRRQAISQVGLYTIGQARIFYSTPCSRVADRGRYYGTNGNGLSNCVASRLAVCNALFNNRQSTPIPWVLPGSSITFSIVDTTFSSYVSLLVSAIYSLPQVAASAIATQFNLPAATQSNIGLGCQYIGPISASAIAAAIAAQSSVTTTAPSSTQAVG